MRLKSMSINVELVDAPSSIFDYCAQQVPSGMLTWEIRADDENENPFHIEIYGHRKVIQELKEHGFRYGDRGMDQFVRRFVHRLQIYIVATLSQYSVELYMWDLIDNLDEWGPRLGTLLRLVNTAYKKK